MQFSEITQQVTWIPVSLLQFAEERSLIEELKFYIAIKLIASGKIKGKNKLFKPLFNLHGIKHHFTFNKRLNRLKQLNWVGYNPSSDYYFIRGYERVCTDLGLSSRTYAEFEIKYFDNFRVFVFAAIIGKKVKSMEYARKKNKEENKLVPKYWEGTKPSVPLPFPDYIGLPVASMAALTGKSMSWCSELKNKAEELGLLKTREKLITVDILPKNHLLRLGLREMYQDCYERFKIRIIKRGKYQGMVKVLEQMPDEIIPLIRFRSNRW